MSWLKDRLQKQWNKARNNEQGPPMCAIAAGLDFGAVSLVSAACSHRWMVGKEEGSPGDELDQLARESFMVLGKICIDWAKTNNDPRWKECSGDAAKLLMRRSFELCAAEINSKAAGLQDALPQAMIEKFLLACLYFGHTTSET